MTFNRERGCLLSLLHLRLWVRSYEMAGKCFRRQLVYLVMLEILTMEAGIGRALLSLLEQLC